MVKTKKTVGARKNKEKEIKLDKEATTLNLRQGPPPLKISQDEMAFEKLDEQKIDTKVKKLKQVQAKKIDVQFGEGSFMDKLKRAGLEDHNIQDETKDDGKTAVESEGGNIIEKIQHLSPGKLRLYKRIAYSFIGLTIILAAIVFYFMMVKTTIVLIPNQERTSNNLIIDVYDSSSGQTPSGNSIVGKISETSVSDEKIISSTGSEVAGETLNGKVIIYNNYIKNQPLVASTRLLSQDGKLFRLKDTVNVPAGDSLAVEIYADDPNVGMEIAPTKFTLPGLWAGIQDKIYAEAKEGIKKEQKVIKIIEQSDIDSGIKDLKESLMAKIKNEISQEYSEYNQVIYNIDNNSIITEISGRAGEEKSEFTIKIKAKADITAFNEDVIIKLAKDKLDSTLPKNKELLDINKKNITYSVSDFSFEQKRSNLNVTFEGVMVLKKDADIIDRKMLVGLSKSQVEEYLNKLSDIAGYEIKFSPSFIKRTPYLVDRIKVEIKK